MTAEPTKSMESFPVTNVTRENDRLNFSGIEFSIRLKCEWDDAPCASLVLEIAVPHEEDADFDDYALEFDAVISFCDLDQGMMGGYNNVELHKILRRIGDASAEEVLTDLLFDALCDWLAGCRLECILDSSDDGRDYMEIYLRKGHGEFAARTIIPEDHPVFDQVVRDESDFSVCAE